MHTTNRLFGLTDKEMEVYEFLLKNSNKNAVDIALKVGMQRPNVYDLLQKLVSKGLVSYNLKSRIKFYSAVHPKKLKEIHESNIDELKIKRKQVDEFVSNLSGIINSSDSFLEIKHYEGLKGMRTVLMEALEQTKKTKKEMLVIRLNDADLPSLDKNYTERFFNFRRKNKIKSRYLMLKDTRFYEDKLVKKKILSDNYRSEVGVYIYGNVVSFWFFPKRDLILAVESKELADTFRNYFEVMWGSV